MQRISTSTRALNLFGSGKDGFKNGDLAVGLQATRLNADWFNSVQEELCRLVVGAGIDLDVEVKTQLLQAVRRMAGGNVRTVTAGHTVLTADDAGLVLVNAAAGAVTLQLPRANELKALPFTFRRLDKVAENSVTALVSGTDVIDGSATSGVLLVDQSRKIVSDGVSGWHSDWNSQWLLGSDSSANGSGSGSGMEAYLTTAAAATTYAPLSSLAYRPGHTYTANDWAWLDKPGGLIFQWGEFTLAATVGSSSSIVLPAAYSALHIASWIGVDNASTDAVGVKSPTLTGLIIQKGAADESPRTGNWFSIGR